MARGRSRFILAASKNQVKFLRKIYKKKRVISEVDKKDGKTN